MSVPVGLTVQLKDLGGKTRLAAGSNGVVYSLHNLRLQDVNGPLAYKEYQGAAASTVTPRALGRVMSVRSRLAPQVLAQFDAATAWPLRMVEDAGRVTGVLMPLIPGDYFCDMRLPSGKTDHVPMELQFLIADARKSQKRGVPVPDNDDFITRLRLCQRFAHALALLHDSQVVFGDLSARNALYRLHPEPGVMFLDCDAVRIHGSVPLLTQQNSPDWEAPEHLAPAGPGRQHNLTLATDRYKLALFVLRCLTPGDHSSVNRDPGVAAGVLDTVGSRLLQAGLSHQHASRPSARQWDVYLSGLVDELTRPPEIELLTVDPDVVLSGGVVTLSWIAKRTQELTITDPAGVIARVPSPGVSGSYLLSMPRSGPLRVRATNKHGSDEQVSPPVRVFPIPEVREYTVPVPSFEQSALPFLDVLLQTPAAPVLAAFDSSEYLLIATPWQRHPFDEGSQNPRHPTRQVQPSDAGGPIAPEIHLPPAPPALPAPPFDPIAFLAPVDATSQAPPTARVFRLKWPRRKATP